MTNNITTQNDQPAQDELPPLPRPFPIKYPPVYREFYTVDQMRERDAMWQARVRAALAHSEQNRADAGRWRFVRDALLTTDGEYFVGVDSAAHEDKWALCGDAADSAIDAARQQAPKEPTA